MPPEVTLNPAQMQQAAQPAAELLKVLANPNRLVLMCLLSQGELSVSDLEARSGIRQPSLSQQLGVLRKHNLVLIRKQGKHVYYLLCHPPALALLSTIYSLYCDPQNQDFWSGSQGSDDKDAALSQDQPR